MSLAKVLIQRSTHWRLRSAISIAVLLCLGFNEQSFGQNLDVNAHDPSRILLQDGRYYVFYTGNRIQMRSSTNLSQWSNAQAVVPTPSWISQHVPNKTDNTYWAPDVVQHNGLYHLYYSVSTLSSQVSAIGLATSPTLNPSAPGYGWTDRGPVITSTTGSPYNAIDPAIFKSSSGDMWMVFGSYWNGVYITPLDPATGLLPSGSPQLQRLAWNTQIEAGYIHERDGFYYLFVNWGTCCTHGVNSTYNIRVGRSTSLTGPYLDQNGVDMVNGGGTLFLEREEHLIGPGHMSIWNAFDSEWFSHHYYDGNQNGRQEMNIRAMLWSSDGWPIAGPAFPANHMTGDVNLDGVISIEDLEDFKLGWLSNTSGLISDNRIRAGDLNFDGITNADDFAILRKALNDAGVTLPPNAMSFAVPEPHSCCLAIGACVLACGLSRRKLGE